MIKNKLNTYILKNILKKVANSIERRVKQKFSEIENKIRISFDFIRKDIEEMQNSMGLIKKYLKNKDKQYEYAKKEDNKLRAEFRKNVDEFTQKIKQLSIALNNVREIEKEVVVRKDLAQIEEGIRNDFRDLVENLREDLHDIEKKLNSVQKPNKKKRWFWQKSEGEEKLE